MNTPNLLLQPKFPPSSVVEVWNFEQLQALSSPPVTGPGCVIVQGRTSPEDGGGGIFLLDRACEPANDDGGICIAAADGGVWRRVVNGPVDVRWFGAIGDGNDTHAKANMEAIQGAIDYCAAQPSGGTVLIASGVYMIDATTPIRLPSDSRLEMATKAVLKALPTSKGSYAVIDIAESTNVTVIGGTVCGERGEHQGTAGQWGMGIRVYSSTDVTIESVTARDCWGDGFYIGKLSKKADESRNVRLIRCVAEGNRRNGCSIVSLIGGLVDGCIFRGTFGTAPECGLDIEPNERCNGTRDCTRNITRDIRIANCLFLENRGCGLSVWKWAESCVVSGAVCRGNGTGIRVRGCYNVVSSSLCASNRVDGISLGGESNSVVNNVCVANGGANIVVGRVKDAELGAPQNKAWRCAMQGNLCRREEGHPGQSEDGHPCQGKDGAALDPSEYGLLVDTNSKDAFVCNNDLLDSAASGDNGLVDQGAGTIAQNNRL